MNKLLCFLCIFYVQFNLVFSQPKNIEVFVGYGPTFRVLTQHDSSNPVFDTIIKNRSVENVIQSFNFGMLFKVKEWKNIVFKTGLHIGGYGFKYPKMTNLRWPSEIGPDGWMPDPNLPREGYSGFNYYFLEIPISCNYWIYKGKWSPYVGLSVSPQYLIGFLNIFVNDKYTSRSAKFDLKSGVFNALASAQIGTYYNISEKWAILANLESSYQLFNNTSTPIRERFYGSRVNLGVSFNL